MFMDIPMTTLNENLLESPVHSSLFEAFEPTSDNKEKNYYIRGKFATIEMVNNNKRFYPRALWEREVEKYQEEIKNGTINTLMEWDHPADRLEVDPSQAIGKITKLWIEGNYVMGEAVIFDTPKAEVLKSMIKHGVQISVSSRARGRVDNAGVVQEFNLITFDFVAKPSDKSATMYGLYEKYLDATNESSGNMIVARSQYVSIPEVYKFLTLDKDGVFNAHITKPRNTKGQWISKDNIKVGFIDLDVNKLAGVLKKDESVEEFRIRETKDAIWALSGTLNIEKALTTINAYGHFYAIKKINLDEGINQMSESKTQDNLNNDLILESLVRQVRTKDSIIDDLKEEINMIKKSRLNEANDSNVNIVKIDGEKISIPSEYKFITFFADGVRAWKTKPEFTDTGTRGSSFEFVGKDNLYIGEVEIDHDYIGDLSAKRKYEDWDWTEIVDDVYSVQGPKCIAEIKNNMNLSSIASKVKIIEYISLDNYDLLNESTDDDEFDDEFDPSTINESSRRKSRYDRPLNELTRKDVERRRKLNESRGRKDLGRRYSRLNESRRKPGHRILTEGDIANFILDNRHDFYHDYNTHKNYEDTDFHYRRAGERLSQTHRHQDHSLLRDSDPTSSTYSGEAEVLRIAKLLQQTFGRDNVVGSRLDKDVDTGLTVRGYAAGIDEEPRFAENGLDFIQRTLSESYDTKTPRGVRREEKNK